MSSGVTVIGASLDESIVISCRVSADPSNVDFEWTFSNSGERFEVPAGHFTTLQDNMNYKNDLSMVKSNDEIPENLSKFELVYVKSTPCI